MGTNVKRMVLLDRDGTIIVEQEYLSNPVLVELLPNAAAGLRVMQKRGLGLVVITNQSGVGRGYFSEEKMHQIHQRMTELLQAEGVTLDGIYFCPHAPDVKCACRKPARGLVDTAAKALGFIPQDSIVIGDKASDVQLGQRIGAMTILVRTGYGKEEAQKPSVAPDYITDDLLAAAQTIQEYLIMEDGGDEDSD
jgi:D-glycero-D-manno-heptose 1,7-bisphosphate phosphatase